MRTARSLLFIDSRAGLLGGVLMLAFAGWLSAFYRMPVDLLVAMGIANLAYGTFSFTLARRASRPRALLIFLIIANALWALFCVVTAVEVAADASIFGVAHLALESLFVGGLAVLEWRYRDVLLGEVRPPD